MKAEIVGDIKDWGKQCGVLMARRSPWRPARGNDRAYRCDRGGRSDRADAGGRVGTGRRRCRHRRATGRSGRY
jgi:hypothetical protein